MDDGGGRTFPRARSAPSKKSMTPSSMKNAPKEVSPTPISVWCVHPDDQFGRSMSVLFSSVEGESLLTLHVC
jgi:hypothetical protein